MVSLFIHTFSKYKLYNVVENALYQKYTHGFAFQNFCTQCKIQHCEYTLDDFKNRNLIQDKNKNVIFVVDAAFCKIYNFSLYELKRYIPNGKIIVFGSDTIYYLSNMNTHEISNVEMCDLYLDTMVDVVDYYNKIGINSDLWKWSFSELYLSQLIKNNQEINKTIDCFSLMSDYPDYRKYLKYYLDNKNINFIISGNKTGWDNKSICQAYGESYCILGSTSPSWTGNIRTMKGYRDYIAPFLNSILIYDNHPQIEKLYFNNDIVPKYDYNNLESIIELINKIKQMSKLDYNNLLQIQKEHFKYDSLEKQYYDLFIKHGVLNVYD